MGIQDRKEREKHQRREAILDAAQKIFFEKELLIATMDDIAEEAELSKGTLYLYFKSKEDIYLAVMMRGVKILEDEFIRIINSVLPVLQKIVMMGRAYVNFFESYPHFLRMFSFAQLQHFHKQVTPEMKEHCSQENRKMWNMIAGVFQQAVHEGLIRSDINIVELTVVLWSNATALLVRIDNEYEFWKKMQIDLKQTLRLSNCLLLESILTEKGKTEFREYEESPVYNNEMSLMTGE
ncbi:MAG TPA: TetR/AcrR family transcriptional regulator [Bacteroidota bacterium]|jgi:AcrR family transcriptional regulator|nr:TetR/AcrR family transcriptional regulator [Bacteroidota bacterium]